MKRLLATLSLALVLLSPGITLAQDESVVVPGDESTSLESTAADAATVVEEVVEPVIDAAVAVEEAVAEEEAPVAAPSPNKGDCEINGQKYKKKDP